MAIYPMTVSFQVESKDDKDNLIEAFKHVVDQRVSMRKIQAEHAEWAVRNFGEQKPTEALLGINEESGELVEALIAYLFAQASIGKINHHRLKMLQNIRGTREEHLAKMRDAVGDVMIYLIDFCNGMGWELEDILKDTWEEVRTRDWKKNPQGPDVDTPGTDLLQLNANPEHSPFDGLPEAASMYYAESTKYRLSKKS